MEEEEEEQCKLRSLWPARSGLEEEAGMSRAPDGGVDDEPGGDQGEALEYLPGHHRLVCECVLVPRVVVHWSVPAPNLTPAPRTSNCRSVVSPNRLGGSGRSGGFTAPSGELESGPAQRRVISSLVELGVCDASDSEATRAGLV